MTVLEGSLYEYLDKEHHIHPTVLTYTLNALLPNKQQQELLQLDSCALLKSSHVSTMDTGELFEYTETFYAGSRYTYRYSRIN